VLSPLIAASATFALRPAVWFPARFVSSWSLLIAGHRVPACQAETPLIALSIISGATSVGCFFWWRIAMKVQFKCASAA